MNNIRLEVCDNLTHFTKSQQIAELAEAFAFDDVCWDRWEWFTVIGQQTTFPAQLVESIDTAGYMVRVLPAKKEDFRHAGSIALHSAGRQNVDVV